MNKVKDRILRGLNRLADDLHRMETEERYDISQIEGPILGSEYVAVMEDEITNIVNDERNW